LKKGQKKAESFKQMNIKYPTNLKMAKWAETCSERQRKPTIKLHADRNITRKTH
jgi:hypothetical protein